MKYFAWFAVALVPGIARRKQQQRGDAGNRNVERKRETASRRQPDANTGEAPRAGADNEPVELPRLNPCSTHELICGREHAARLGKTMTEQLTVSQQRARRRRRGGVKGEDRLHCRS